MYVDAFVMPVTKAREDEYLKLAENSAKVWMDHGALSYVEARADDVPNGELTSFPRSVHLAEDEILYFSWATYRDRAHRDAVMTRVMADPRMPIEMVDVPANLQRMIFGGFDIRVSA